MFSDMTDQRSKLLPDDSPCSNESTFLSRIEGISLIVSGSIIVVLSLLERRSINTRWHGCGRRPALIYPVNMLDHGCDNFGYSMAFGGVASHCFRLFFNRETLTNGPPWSQTLYVMLYVLVVGLMFYPMFACLSTNWRFLGATMGLGYSTMWLFINFSIVIRCPNGDGNLPGETIATQLPVLICLIGLSLRFLFIMVNHTRKAIQSRSANRFIEHTERDRLGTKFNIQYVKDLLLARSHVFDTYSSILEERPSWSKKISVFLRRHFYMNDPTFKYSPKIVCIFTVAFICSYQFGIIILLASYQLQQLGKLLIPANQTANGTDEESIYQLKLFFTTTNVCIIAAFILSSVLTIFSIFKILTNYRTNIKLLYRGKATHLPFQRGDRHPIFLMSDSISYSGSQIAYLLWGYIVVFAVLFITLLGIAYLLLLPIFGFISRDVLKYFWNIIPGFLILQGILIAQKVFCRGLLQRRPTTDPGDNIVTSVTLALDNRKVYHNISYFLFFFYIVLGVFGCFLTIIKGVILGVIYLARLDRCGLVSGFETWDTGYMYYVSFLHFEECHRHPVLLVFCDILFDAHSSRKDTKLHRYGACDSRTGSTADLEEQNTGSSRGGEIISTTKTRVKNRWLKAYTLLRNPSIQTKPLEEDYDTLEELGKCDSDSGTLLL